MLVEQIMHLPELALRGRCLRRFRRMLGMRMRLGQREIPKHKTHLVAKAFLQGLHDRIRLAAVWTLVIAVLDDRHRRLRRSLRVIVRADRRLQFCRWTHRATFYFFTPSCSSASSIPSAPGLTPTGDR